MCVWEARWRPGNPSSSDGWAARHERVGTAFSWRNAARRNQKSPNKGFSCAGTTIGSQLFEEPSTSFDDLGVVRLSGAGDVVRLSPEGLREFSQVFAPRGDALRRSGSAAVSRRTSTPCSSCTKSVDFCKCRRAPQGPAFFPLPDCLDRLRLRSVRGVIPLRVRAGSVHWRWSTSNSTPLLRHPLSRTTNRR